ncbi:MAG: hypothetical protein WAL71_10290 [Terriglobales bacterium]
MPVILAVILAVLAGAALAQTVQRPFSLGISVEHDTVKAGSPIVVKIRFKNISDHDLVRMRRPEGDAHGELLGFPPIVRDAQGNEPPLTRKGRLIFGRQTPEDKAIYVGVSVGATAMHPGEVITPEIRLSELYDMSAPGKYTVQVWHYDEEHKDDVKSNAITVTVVP